jgi:outer membrane cobalamin receptor
MPSLSASLRPFDDFPFYLRMLYKNTFRMPTFNELYYLRSGNRVLRPESANEYNMGVTWQVHQWGIVRDMTITADGYFNQVKDKIVAFPTTYDWLMANY